MSKKWIIAVALVALFVPAAAFAGPAVVREYQLGRQLAAVRAATAKYQSVDAAIADGYVPTEHCIDGPDGGMGFHYLNPALAGDLKNDPLKPELMIYAPSGDGKLKLVAVEYFQANAGQPRPTIMGQPFDGPMAGHEPGMPEHYDLHLWIWANNPSGVFAPWNTSVSCKHAH